MKLKERFIQWVADEVMKRMAQSQQPPAQAGRERAEALLREYPKNKASDIEARRQDAATVDAFLQEYADDPYIDAVRLFYFEGLKNSAVAAKIPCDETTCRRNRSRLVKAFMEKISGEMR